MKLPVLCVSAIALLAVSAVASPDRIIAHCDAPGEWHGGRIVSHPAKTGSGSLAWAHDADTLVALATVPADWTTHPTVSFWLHNDTADSGAVNVILVSDDDATDGTDCYSCRLTMAFTGWKQFLLPRMHFAASSSPRGWHAIEQLHFTSLDPIRDPNPSRTIHIDDIRLTDSAATGPRMTQAELFGLFDRGVAGLSSFFSAVDSTNHPQARRHLAEYYRSRTHVPWVFDPHTIDSTVTYDSSVAADAVRGAVTVIGIPFTFPDSTIDWFYNVTTDRPDLADNDEWQWQLNRHTFWAQLGRAWWHTGDEAYADAFVRQLRSWIRDCPRPDNAGNYPVSAWRTLDTGIRLFGSWAECWHRFLHAPALTDNDLVLFLLSFVEQARHLRVYQSSGGNHVIHEMAGLYTAGGLFPELVPAAEWRTFAMNLLGSELQKQILPDGAHMELSTAYHYVTLDHAMCVYGLAGLFGRANELPAGGLDALERGYAYGVYLMAPDGTLPLLNDAWTIDVAAKTDAVRACFPSRGDFAWCATGGSEGTPPGRTSLRFPYAGTCVMREDWSDTANYLVMDAGLPGYGHVHHDKLNVVVWSGGRQILYDGGGGNYESSIWREYAISTFAHNTVNIDHLGQRSSMDDPWALVPDAPVPLAWQTSERYDFAAAYYDGGYGSPANRIARHKRQVLFLKPDLFIVADFMVPSDGSRHEYEARWHLLTTEVAFDSLTGNAVTTTKDEPNMIVAPLLTSDRSWSAVSGRTGTTTADIAGWRVVKNATRHRTTTVRHTVSGSGPHCLLTLLRPVPPGVGNDLMSVEQSSPLSARAELLDGSILHVSLTSDTGDTMIALLVAPGGDTIVQVAVDGSVPVADPRGEARTGSTVHTPRVHRTPDGVVWLTGVLPDDRVALYDLLGRLLWYHRTDPGGDGSIRIPEHVRRGFVTVVKRARGLRRVFVVLGSR